jgi:DNA-binding CsgD family transcriptional regulator
VPETIRAPEPRAEVVAFDFSRQSTPRALGGGAALRLRLVARGLTEAEARAAQRLAAGGSLAEAAFGLGVTVNTLKTHLKRVYEKLEVRRQSELVFLLSRLV